MNPPPLGFRDRAEAGERLADRLESFAGQAGLLVLALPRGGVPVGAAVARRLGAPLDVLVVRKLGAPGQEELAVGAIGPDAIRVLNEEVAASLRIAPAELDAIAAREQAEVDRRDRAYRRGRPPPEVAGRTVIVVDDGLATGATARAAIAVLRRRGAGRIAVAVPVASIGAAAAVRAEADDFAAVIVPEDFFGVGQWYEDFSQTSDAEVLACLDLSRSAAAAPRSDGPGCARPRPGCGA